MISSSGVLYPLRALARAPVFTMAAVATLALGIGANVSIFSLANSMLIRPLPGLTDPEGLVTVRFYSEDGAYFPVSHPNYSDFRDEARPYSQLTTYQPVPIHLITGEEERPERLDGEIVSANYFEVMRIAPALGRLLSTDDAAPGAAPAAVISHRLWRRAFGGDPGIVGSEITLNGKRFAVIGVAPDRYQGAGLPSTTDVWVPISAHATVLPYHEGDVTTDRGNAIWFQLIGRLRAGTTAELAERRLAVTTASLVEAYPKQNRMLSVTTPRVTPGAGADPFQRARMEKTLSIMLGAVFFVLLLAWANALNLVLARTTGRQREIAIRRALGAGGFRLFRLFMAEGVILGLAAGGIGLILSAWMAGAFEGTRIIRWLPGIRAPELDWRVLAVTLVSSLAAGLALGAVPSLVARRPTVPEDPRGARDTRRRSRLQSALVTGQVAISLLLLIGAGLLVRTVRNLETVDLGMQTRGVLTFSLEPGLQGYSDDRTRSIFRELLDRLDAIPSVESAAMAWLRPFDRHRANERLIPFGAELEEDAWISASANMVSPDFFRSLAIPVIAGRSFTRREFLPGDESKGRAVIINESLARSLFPDDENPAGRQVALYLHQDTPVEIVGVVRDARMWDVAAEAGPQIYEPFGDGFLPKGATFLVRTARGDAAVLSADVRRLVASLDLALPVYDLRTMKEQIGDYLAEERLSARLSSLLALLALLLAALGLYAVLAHSVAARTREFGIRSALGAPAQRVLVLMLGQSLRTLMAGIAVGLLGAGLLTRLIESRLYGVGSVDIAVYTLAVIALVIVGLTASYLPARRATRVDPVVALNSE